MKSLFVLNTLLPALILIPAASAQVAELQGLPSVPSAASAPSSPGRAANFLVGGEVIVPQFIIGGEWTSTLRLVNNGSAAITAKEGYFFDSEGQSLSATFKITGGQTITDRGFSYTLPPGAVLEIDFTGTQTTQFGHIRLNIDGCPYTDTTCSLYGEVVLRNRNASRPDFESVFPLEMPFPNQQMLYDHRNGVGTTLYLVNSNTSSDTVTLLFGNPSNGLLRSVDVTVPGLGARILTLQTLAPETVGSQGVLYIRAVNSEGTVALLTATGLRINPSNSFTPIRPYITKNQYTR